MEIQKKILKYQMENNNHKLWYPSEHVEMGLPNLLKKWWVFTLCAYFF